MGIDWDFPPMPDFEGEDGMIYTWDPSSHTYGPRESNDLADWVDIGHAHGGDSNLFDTEAPLDGNLEKTINPLDEGWASYSKLANGIDDWFDHFNDEMEQRWQEGEYSPKHQGEIDFLANVLSDLQFDGNWLRGRWRQDPNILVQAKLFAEPSQFGINGGRISKLFARDEITGQTLLDYDRGWDVPGVWVDRSQYLPEEWQEIQNDPAQRQHYETQPDPRATALLKQIEGALQNISPEVQAISWPDYLPEDGPERFSSSSLTSLATPGLHRVESSIANLDDFAQVHLAWGLPAEPLQPPAMIQPGMMAPAQMPEGVNLPTMTGTPATPSVGPGGRPEPTNPGVQYDYQGNHWNVMAASISLDSAEVSAGHVAVWLGVSNTTTTEWAQAGIEMTNGQAGPHVYFEIGAGGNTKEYRSLRPYQFGETINVTLQHKGDEWSVLINGQPVASTRIQGQIQTSATAEDWHAWPTNKYTFRIVPHKQTRKARKARIAAPKINPVGPGGFYCTRCGEGPYGTVDALQLHIETVHGEKFSKARMAMSYHVSPRSNREQIEQEGLTVQNENHAGSPQDPDGIYYWDTPEQAAYYRENYNDHGVGRNEYDTWEFDLLPEEQGAVRDDPFLEWAGAPLEFYNEPDETPGGHYLEGIDRIAPERLRRLEGAVKFSSEDFMPSRQDITMRQVLEAIAELDLSINEGKERDENHFAVVSPEGHYVWLFFHNGLFTGAETYGQNVGSGAIDSILEALSLKLDTDFYSEHSDEYWELPQMQEMADEEARLQEQYGDKPCNNFTPSSGPDWCANCGRWKEVHKGGSHFEGGQEPPIYPPEDWNHQAKLAEALPEPPTSPVTYPQMPNLNYVLDYDPEEYAFGEWISRVVNYMGNGKEQPEWQEQGAWEKCQKDLMDIAEYTLQNANQNGVGMVATDTMIPLMESLQHAVHNNEWTYELEDLDQRWEIVFAGRTSKLAVELAEPPTQIMPDLNYVLDYNPEDVVSQGWFSCYHSVDDKSGIPGVSRDFIADVSWEQAKDFLITPGRRSDGGIEYTTRDWTGGWIEVLRALNNATANQPFYTKSPSGEIDVVIDLMSNFRKGNWSEALSHKLAVELAEPQLMPDLNYVLDNNPEDINDSGWYARLYSPNYDASKSKNGKGPIWAQTYGTWEQCRDWWKKTWDYPPVQESLAAATPNSPWEFAWRWEDLAEKDKSWAKGIEDFFPMVASIEPLSSS